MKEPLAPRRGAPVADEGRRFVGSIDKAFRVLSAFSAADRPLGLSELARSSGVERSATQRILFTLRHLGYIRQDPETRLYSLAALVLELGQAYLRAHRVRERAQPVLEAANRICEETVNLTVLEDTDVIYVLRYPSRHVVSVDLSVGSRLPAFCTAPGRAILAFLSLQKSEAILDRSPLERRTPFTRITRAEIEDTLQQVRRTGYCVANQEAFVGDISIAAPVFDTAGQVIAAVNIAVPYPRWSLVRVKRELTPVVVECARNVSQALAE
jgi:IclR family transcriptional regulator, pca regulon regulatory protein